MTDILKESNFGKTFSQVEASVKKHEAIAADVISRVIINLFVDFI